MLILLASVVSFLAGAGLVAFWTFGVWSQVRTLSARRVELDQRQKTIADLRERLDHDRAVLEQRTISYDELENENRILKTDLRNIDVSLRKLELDRNEQAKQQENLDARSTSLAERYLRDVQKSVGSSISANNYAACKQRLAKAIAWSREIGFEVDAEREDQLLSDLKADFEKAVRATLEREEQARIKKQIREEQALEREIKKEMDRLAREREAIQAALDKALAEAEDEHSAEVELLRARLAEAEEKTERAKSRAQLTRAGHIYVISNIGSFGENVYKIGMTRRLEPKIRVKELGDASVPFPFDVHMMISCDDAPSLENAMHREFHGRRLNRVNRRKEFFRVELDEIRAFVESQYGEVDYVADAEALEYRQSLEMSDEDQQYMDDVVSRTEQELGLPDVDE